MCGSCFGYGVLAAIFAAIFAILFFNGFWLQFSWVGRWGTSMELGVLFVQYIVAFIFLGAAKMLAWKAKDGHKGASKKR